MQYLNDDNMDELFRRAADDYPLKTDSGNWDKVMTTLQTENADVTSDKNAAKKNRYRKYLWLLLLLPMAWICNGKFFMNDSKQAEDNVIVKNAEQPKTTSAAKTPKTDDKNFDSKSIQLSTAQKNNSEKNIASSKTQNNIKANKPVQLTDATSTDKLNTTITKAVHQNHKIKIANNKSGALLSLNDNKRSQKNKSVSLNDKKDKQANTVSDNDDNNIAVENKPIEATPETKNDGIGKNNIIDEVNNAGKSLDITETIVSKKIDTTQIQKQQIVQQSTKKNSPEKTKIHFLYAGVLGGFDVSTVKFQSVKNTGYTAGILLGYQLNKKLSIESGFLIDKKFYYTDGEHFNTQKLVLYPNTTILNVTGSCFMYEVPVNIKYNWASTAKSSWFSTLGLSSYFMKKEDYDYSLETPTWMPWSQPESYSNSSVNWFGVINLSGGYMHTLGKAGSLRVEPYVKVPVQGLGIGSLSVWSTGIYVSFIKKIF